MSDQGTDSGFSADDVAKDDIPLDMFQVKITGTGVELTRTVDQATALSVIATVLGGGAAVPPAAGGPSGAYVPPTPSGSSVGTHRHTPSDAGASDGINTQMTIGEFIDECDAKRNPEKITAIGYYLEVRLGQGSFTRDEVKSQFRPAGETLPGNYSRDFNDAIAQRWIAEDPDAKGRYYVSNTGKAAIAEKFSKPIRRAPTRRKKAATKSDNGNSSSSEIDDFQELDDDE